MTQAEPGLRERGKRRRTERILDAGLELLREEPDQLLTVERIAARAEVAPMTVFNLVGNREQLWGAMADRALEQFDVSSIDGVTPRDRARRIVEAVVRVLRSDPDVFRELLTGWGHSRRVLAHDPTRALTDCLREAVAGGSGRSDVDVRLYGEVMAAGMMGTIHQWTTGLISDRAFGIRARAVVDITFDAAGV